MKTMPQQWILQGDDPAPTPPVPAGIEYHRVYVPPRSFVSLAHGTRDPFLLTSYLVPSAALVLVTAIVWWLTRTTGPARTPAAYPPSGSEQ